VVVLGGCGERSPGTLKPVNRPLTENQAVQLSTILYRNYTEGGAQIDAQVPYSASVFVGIAGVVDFAHHTGHLTVLTTEKGDAPTTQSVDYSAGAVYVAQPDSKLPGGVGWTMRAPDPADRPIDRVIQLIVALASPQRDNPLLVAQSQARFTGQRSFNGTTVNVFRYTPSIVYWVGASDGLLNRFIGTVQGIAGPVTIDLTKWGPHLAPPPLAAQIVSG
jgi:hypothetical protein